MTTSCETDETRRDMTRRFPAADAEPVVDQSKASSASSASTATASVILAGAFL